MGKQEAHQEMR